MRGIGKAPLQERAGGRELAKPEVVNRLPGAAKQLRRNFVPLRADLFKFALSMNIGPLVLANSGPPLGV